MGRNRDQPRCATERVEAVTSLDILYSRFHEIAMSTMQASDGKKSCGQKYHCPDGEPECETRYYMIINITVQSNDLYSDITLKSNPRCMPRNISKNSDIEVKTMHVWRMITLESHNRINEKGPNYD